MEANSVMDYLDRVFGSNMLALKSRQGEPWAPSSPDLSACDFLLWGYVKDKVYKPISTSMNQLKQRINQEMNAVPKEMVQAAVYNTKKRARKLVSFGGEAFEGRKPRVGIRL